MFDWNDLRYFLATARGGSTVVAARLMRVNQSTVGRRVAALERALGARLFDKTVSGSQLTAVGRDLLPVAERAELEMDAALRLVERRTRSAAGTIKVTTNETIADLFLMPCLAEFAKLYPEVRVDVIVSSRLLDLERGEADIALRASRHRPARGALAKQLAELPWAIYCSREYATANGRAVSAEQLSGHKIIGVDGPLASVAGFDWLEKHAGDEAVVARTNSLPNLLAAVRAGLGISALPCVRGESDPRLARCIGPGRELGSVLWLVMGTRAQSEPGARALGSFLVTKAPVLRELLRFKDQSDE